MPRDAPAQYGRRAGGSARVSADGTGETAELDGFTEIIDGWLEGDVGINRKQRHTAKRVFERLRDEHGTGGYTIVKDYMRLRQALTRAPNCFVKDDLRIIRA